MQWASTSRTSTNNTTNDFCGYGILFYPTPANQSFQYPNKHSSNSDIQSPSKYPE